MNDILDIIIPVYNEGENILKTIAAIRSKIKTPYRIFIIYDFDEDNTLPAIRTMPDAQGICLVKNKHGSGVLNAVKTGFDTAGEHSAILVVMADLSDDLAKADEMFGKICEGYDIVCGSRYMAGGKQVGGPKFKGFLSRMAGLSLHYLIGIPTHDITNSFKLYSKKVLANIKIESDGGFELGMEILIKAYLAGYRITEIPSVWRDRSAGCSRFRLWKWLPKYLYWYYYAIRHNKRS